MINYAPIHSNFVCTVDPYSTVCLGTTGKLVIEIRSLLLGVKACVGSLGIDCGSSRTKDGVRLAPSCCGAVIDYEMVLGSEALFGKRSKGLC